MQIINNGREQAVIIYIATAVQNIIFDIVVLVFGGTSLVVHGVTGSAAEVTVHD